MIDNSLYSAAIHARCINSKFSFNKYEVVPLSVSITSKNVLLKKGHRLIICIAIPYLSILLVTTVFVNISLAKA